MNDRDSQLEAAYHATRQGLDQSLELIDVLHRDLDAMRDELAWSHRLSTLGTLAATLAHEFNNLLTPIGIYAQLALRDPDDQEKTKRALEAAVKGIAQAGRLSEATLGFAGPTQQGEDAQCAVRDVVEQALICLDPKLKQQDVIVEQSIGDERVAIEPLSMQQVIVNLVTNAIKAMSGTRGKRTIGIETERRGDHILIRVSDSGPGIREEIRDNLFEPFVTQHAAETCASNDCLEIHADQAGDATETKSGTGLGLNICKTLIESAGGSIELADKGEAGEGACFVIALPDDTAH